MKIDPARPLSILRNEPGLFAFDMDSTLVDGEGVDELAREYGCYDEVAKITESAMRGEIDFSESLRRRIALLAGLGLDAIDAAYSRMPLMPGAIELFHELRKMGHKTAIVSGGFDFLAERYARDLGGVDFMRVNQLELDEGKLTGQVIPPIVDAQGKADGLREAARSFRIPLTHTVAVGDGANDVLLLQAAGFGIAFRAKPKLRLVAKHAIDEKDLSLVLSLL
jgi:phosphoserine phosphatase